MKLADLVSRYRSELESKYGSRLLPEQRQALDAITDCQTERSQSSLAVCPKCHKKHWHHHSCGNRSCPQCQNHLSTQWLDRQRVKLLPVPYYLVTFTIPSQLRTTVYSHQRLLYEALFTAAVATVQEVASNPRHLGAEPGITAVLHTNTRRLDYHPHIHLLIPAGGLDTKEQLWIPGKRDYLFPVAALRKLFRGKFLAVLRNNRLPYSKDMHAQDWCVNIRSAGFGEHALEYLSRYLYRGVISEDNIIAEINGKITFTYREGGTHIRKTRTLPAADFLYLILQHVLPKRFRRVRDFGFLHGNAKQKLRTIQLLLKAPIQILPTKPSKRAIPCPRCGTDMDILLTRKRKKHNYYARGSPGKVKCT